MVKKNNIFKVITLLFFILLIAVNIIVDYLPVNGITTLRVSSLYLTLITPANFTFIICIVIYILLGFFTLYQLKVSRSTALSNKQFNELRYYFCASSFGNILWLFAWHYNMIDVSVIVLLMIFYCLLSSVKLLHTINVKKTDILFLNIPFELYFGWTLIAIIINVAIFLRSIKWDGLGISMEVWSAAALLLGLFLAAAAMLKYKSKCIGISAILTYLGILVRHLLPDGFDMRYPVIIIIAIAGIAVLAAFEFLVHRQVHSLQKE